MFVTEDCKELFKALSQAQGEFTTVEKNAKNPHFNSKFAPLDSIIEMIRPILPKHGLSVVQFTDIPESGNGVIIETIITHDSGQYISGRLQMPTVKQDPQGYGSSITYGRRYALGAALGIVSDEDVDGNQPEGAERQTRTQQKAQQGAKSAPQGQKAAQGNQGQGQTKEPATAEQLAKIADLVLAIQNRDGGSEADILKTISLFPGTNGDIWLTPDTLEKKCTKGYAGKIIGKAEAMLK